MHRSRSPEYSAQRPAGPIHTGLAIIVLGMGALKAAYADLIAPIPQSEVLSSSMVDTDCYIDDLPPPDTDSETLLLCRYETINRFFSTHGTVPRTTLGEFFVTYGESPDALHNNNWQGPCNNFMTFFGEWGTRRGHPVYSVNLVPRNVLQITSRDWHQIGAICVVPDREYLIADNTRITLWKGTLEEYIECYSPELCIAPVCGIRRWYRTQDNFFGRTAIQMGTNEEMEPTTVPIRSKEKEGAMVAAAA